ncbi:hypothetical protein PV325_003847 [Microctonus aethiopoides]|nr:hypothetical protein PV325_003847 [Microctonus aethiopoides]
MSESRRRRKSEQSGASDEHSDSFDELNVTKETQSSEQTEERRDSEYDTAGSDAESDGGSQDGVQRESGDGQEEDKPQKKLDDDEDRRNPQYIPKRGTFYEHDDRTTEEAAEDAPEQPPERETKEKKVWKDKEDRWDHDRYNDEEQAPKSHEELIAVYGYDIRNEEDPPRARRRRRYGRGPNKYTRNWADEDAYGKTAGNVNTNKPNKRINKTGEEFPALGGSKDTADVAEEPVISSAWYSNKNKIHNKQQNFPPLQLQQDNQKTKAPSINNTHTNENKAPNEPTNPAWKKDAKYTSESLALQKNNTPAEMNDKPLTVHASKSIHTNKRHVQESVNVGTGRTRGRGFNPNVNNNLVTNRTVDSKPKGRGSGLITGDMRRNNTNQHNDEQIVNDIKHMNVNDAPLYYHSGRQQNKNFYAQASNQQRQNTTPPRMQPTPSQQPPPSQQQQQTHQQSQPDVAGNRPKRYSSLRQRPTIPDVPGQQTYPTPHGQHGFYPPQGFPPAHFEPPPPVPTPAPALATQPVMPLPNAGQPAPYAPPTFLVPPPQFITPQAAPPNIINYVPGPNGPAFPPNFPGYQGYNPTSQGPPPPPPELFQPQGCTYYNPAQQPPQQPQSAPLRRPKAAIPILPPPDNTQHHQNGRGRGRVITQQIQTAAPGFNQISDDIETRSDEIDVEATEKESTEIFENASSLTPSPPLIETESPVIIEETEKVSEVIAPQPLIDLMENNESAMIIDNLSDQLIPDVIELQKTIESAAEILPISNELINEKNEIINNDIKTTDVEITKNIDIGTISIPEASEVTKVESVVHENPVVEEAVA